jgi:5'-nucleotidase
MLLERQDLLAVGDRFTINVNVPNLPFDELKGIAVAGLGRRIYEDEMVEGIDPRGRPYYWIGAGGEMFEDIPDSDCYLVDQGYATVSVLRPSLLDERANDQLRAKLPDAFSEAFQKSFARK